MSLLEISKLSVLFGAGSQPFSAVDGLDLRVNQGEIVGIAGESGSGKSVTMMALLGLLGTGMTIWARRTFRRRPARRPGTTPQPAQINVVPESEVAR